MSTIIRIDLLKGRIAQQGLSMRRLAKRIGMPEKTFYYKIKKGVFVSTEIDDLIQALSMDTDEACRVFLAGTARPE